MKVDLSSLFVCLGGGLSPKVVLPIAAIKGAMQEETQIKLYLKEEYSFDGRSYVMLDAMSLRDIAFKVNDTIKSALKELGDDA